jgi:DNA-binding transcriptional MerR regulator
VDERTIQRWAKKGLIKRIDIDCYDLESAIGYVLGDLRSQIESLNGTSVENPESLPSRKLLAECRKLEAEAGKKEIELEQLKGELLPREEVLGEVVDAFAKIRAKVSAIPSKTALELSGLDSPLEIQRLLEGACDEVLAELNSEFLGGDDGHSA